MRNFISYGGWGGVPKGTLPHHTDKDKEGRMRVRKRAFRKGRKKKKVDWNKPYRPTTYDLERDPTLKEQRPPFNWKMYREFKAKEKNR
jgi:hypothetical protein